MSSSEEILIFNELDEIGNVIYVDSEKLLIEILHPESVAKICIGNIVGIQTTKKHETLIGLVNQITRKYSDLFDALEANSQEFEETSMGVSSSDFIKVNLIGTYYQVKGDLKNIFKRGINSFPQISSTCYLILNENLKNFMGILNNNINSELSLKIGSFMMDNMTDAILDGNKFFQRHAAILGSTGSGKSWCVAKILEEVSKLKYGNLIVFDMHGEYTPLAKGADKIAESFRIAGPGDLDSSSTELLFLPYWLLNREELLSMILDRSDQNAPNQSSRFTFHIQELKSQTLEDNYKKDVLTSFTVDSPIPFKIDELVEKLKQDDTEKKMGANNHLIKGDWEGKLTRFISRLETKLKDKRYGFLFQSSEKSLEYSWLNDQVSKLLGFNNGNSKALKIIDFSEVPSDILPVVTGTLARLLYETQFWMNPNERTPFTLVCDEAHLYLPTKEDADTVQKQALYSFERIAKEGRKYGVSILAISQRPADVSRTILSQCNNFIVLRLTNDTDKNVVKNLLPDSLKDTIGSLPLLDVGEALVVGDSILIPSKVLLEKPSPSHQPSSGTKDFWDEWDTKFPSKQALEMAVESLRKQSRSLT